MSESLVKMNVVTVNDSRLSVEGQQTYAIINGPQISLSKPYNSTSISSSNVSFNNINPPSTSVFVSKEFLLTVTYLVNFTGTASGGTLLLDSWGHDMSARCLFINNSFSNISIGLNNATFTSDLNDIIPAIQRVNFKNSAHLISSSCTTTDQSQKYSELVNGLNDSVRNPLGAYGVSPTSHIPNRGGQLSSYKILTNTAISGSMLITGTEPIMVSPLNFNGQTNSVNFTHLTNITINGVFDNNLVARVLSISDNCPSTFSNITCIPQSASIQFTYLTPPALLEIPKAISYDYYPIQRFITDNNTALSNGGTATTICNSLQLSSVPKKLLIFVRQSKNNFTYSSTDTFCRINSVQIEYANRSGILSSSSPQQLYNMSKSNGVDMSYPEWYGQSYDPTDLLSNPALFPRFVSGVGSVIAIQPVKDFGLLDSTTSGTSGAQMLQISVNYSSLYKDNTPRFFSVYVLVVSDGVVTLMPSVCYQSDSIVSPNDLLTAKMVPAQYTNNDVLSQQSMIGGDFFGSIKSFFTKHGPALLSLAKMAAPIIAPMVGLGCGLVGGAHNSFNNSCHACHKTNKKYGGNVGGGNVGGGIVGGLIGGAKLNRKSLKNLMY